ncbi:MAG: hypothetical protein RQ833_03710 [Sphingomonadaceae bacterium]|nr:hypothetical protein [Sphingomonadaceae bacterium]
MTWVPGYRVPLVPALGAAAALIALVIQLALPGETPLPPAPPVRSGRVRVAVAQPALPPVAVGVDIVRGTAFAPTRSVAPGAGAQPGAAARPAQAITLLGSARAGARAVAVFRDETGASVTTPVGGRVSGWRLIALGRDSAVVIRDGERRVLRLGVPLGAATGARAPGSGGG